MRKGERRNKRGALLNLPPLRFHIFGYDEFRQLKITSNLVLLSLLARYFKNVFILVNSTIPSPFLVFFVLFFFIKGGLERVRCVTDRLE